MGSLLGKTALVTGSSRGIGRGIAERLASDGARVAVHYGHNAAAASDTVAAIKAAGGDAFAIQAVLGEPGDAATLWKAFDEHADGVDILVNNAGGALVAPLDQLDETAFDEAWALNAKAPVFIIKHALPRLRNGGRIVNITTGALRVAIPQSVGYVATKSPAMAITPVLAWELGPRDITVNVVSPGFVETEQTAWIDAAGMRDAISRNTAGHRIGRPDDIADVVSFLASDDSRWVTGQVIEASGGTYIGAPQ